MPEEVLDDSGLTKDEFSMAFEAASGLADPEIEEPVLEGTEPVEPEPVVEPVVETPPEPVVEAKPEPVVEVKPEPVAPPEPAVAAAPSEPEPVALADEAFTEEELALIPGLKENFPEVSTLLDAVQRVALAKAENKFAAKIQELETKLSQSFAPAINVAQSVAHDKFIAAVTASHADAIQILPKVEEWVKTQPEFLQNAYNDVLDRGTAEQTIKLYDIFKKETGSAQVPPLPSPEDAEAKAAKEKNLRSMEGVRTRQAAQKGGIDENDFEGAFAVAATKH